MKDEEFFFPNRQPRRDFFFLSTELCEDGHYRDGGITHESISDKTQRIRRSNVYLDCNNHGG